MTSTEPSPPDPSTLAPFPSPYVPGSEFVPPPAAMPRSTVDGIHGTRDDDPVRWSPSHEGELPPYWTNKYVQDKHDPDLWWPAPPAGPNAVRPDMPGDVGPRTPFANAGHQTKPDDAGQGNKLDVTPSDLTNAAGQYADLQQKAAAIGPQAVEEVNRIIASHGAMGYPVAVGVLANLARKQAQIEAKSAQFGVYSTRFTEHAATYQNQDSAGAAGYQQAQFI